MPCPAQSMPSTSCWQPYDSKKQCQRAYSSAEWECQWAIPCLAGLCSWLALATLPKNLYPGKHQLSHPEEEQKVQTACPYACHKAALRVYPHSHGICTCCHMDLQQLNSVLEVAIRRCNHQIAPAMCNAKTLHHMQHCCCPDVQHLQQVAQQMSLRTIDEPAHLTADTPYSCSAEHILDLALVRCLHEDNGEDFIVQLAGSNPFMSS